jgi:hypothetical protein
VTIGLYKASAGTLMEHQLDISTPEIVQVLVDKDRSVLHVNVDGICVLRIQHPKHPIEVEL